MMLIGKKKFASLLHEEKSSFVLTNRALNLNPLDF
jgi:hypothetical protein